MRTPPSRQWSGQRTARRDGSRWDFTSSAAYRLLPRILSAYRSAYPAVAFDFTEATSAEQWDALRAGKLDVALLRSVHTAGGNGFRCVRSRS
ncbi:LysR substrate-binding domain-containing protein [Cupriavidus basilensis]